MTSTRRGEPDPLWQRARTWPIGWRVVAWILAWPFLLTSRLWDDGRAGWGQRVAAIALALVVGVPWSLAIAVLASSLAPGGTGEDSPVEVPDDLFAPLDEPVQAPSDT